MIKAANRLEECMSFPDAGLKIVSSIQMSGNTIFVNKALIWNVSINSCLSKLLKKDVEENYHVHCLPYASPESWAKRWR